MQKLTSISNFPEFIPKRAYETLSDEKRRKMYDSGFDAEGQGAGQPPPGWQGAGGFSDFGGFQGFEQFSQGFNGGGAGFDPFESIFEMMNEFSRGGRGRHAGSARRDVQRGRDITIGIEISFMDAIKGATRSVNYERTEVCPSCKGTGGKNGTGYTTCSHCRGTGTTGMRRGGMQILTTCNKCKGEGQILKNPCEYCDS